MFYEIYPGGKTGGQIAIQAPAPDADGICVMFEFEYNRALGRSPQRCADCRDNYDVTTGNGIVVLHPQAIDFRDPRVQRHFPHKPIYVGINDARFLALQRAVDRYRDTLFIDGRQTQQTLQGTIETGFVVWGRAHGGDQVGCLFSTRREAAAYIAAAEAGE